MVREKIKPLRDPEATTGNIKFLVLYNDDVNTFDFVIDSLIEVCHHEPEQAEQCALIAHLKGKCSIKEGESLILKPLEQEMIRRGLTVSISD